MMVRWCSFCTRSTRLNWIIYSASLLKQQSESRHATPLGNIILIPSMHIFLLLLKACVLRNEATNTNVIVIRLTSFTTLETSTLTITPQTWFTILSNVLLMVHIYHHESKSLVMCYWWYIYITMNQNS